MIQPVDSPYLNAFLSASILVEEKYYRVNVFNNKESVSLVHSLSISYSYEFIPNSMNDDYSSFSETS
jgi:hypothetical protein